MITLDSLAIQLLKMDNRVPASVASSMSMLCPCCTGAVSAAPLATAVLVL